MPASSLLQLPILDLVPFGNPGGHTGFYALRLAPPGWSSWKPGQFVMLRPVGCGSETLWARPFSICTAGARDLVIFFQVRGRATAQLAKLQAGTMMNVWGPLGNAFASKAKSPTLILAGGIGIAPFVGYVHTHPTPWDITLEFGHRMPLECYPFESLSDKASASSHLEQSDADRAAFLELAEQRIAEFAKDGLILACGPTPFLQAVQKLARKHNTRAQLSLETRMACGVGACLGCVVKAGKDGSGQQPNDAPGTDPADYHHVQTCSCGPVFWSDNVLLS